MENKQLNFSAPLLSARRYSSPLRCSDEQRKIELLPPGKMNIKGDVVKPGSIPFLWEQIPGRAKGDDSRLHKEGEENPTTTRPARFVRSGDLTSFYKSQNRLSGELNLKYRPPPLSGELNLIRHKLSGELSRRPVPNRLHSHPIPTNEMAMRTLLMDGFDRTGGGGDGGGSGSRSDSDDDGDTAFSDAVDALESFSMKCSTTGLSASDNHQTPIPVEPLSSQSESQNREFMINRFLPAAKAMTLDSSSPHYSTTNKRQLMVVEQPPLLLSKSIIPKIVKESTTGVPTPTSKQQDLSMSYASSGLDIGSQRSDNNHDDYADDSSDDFKNSNGHGVTVKSCGFFPWFCSKNALRLLNPVPAMRVKTKNALASATKVGRNLVKNASPSRSFSKQQQQQVSRTSRVHKVMGSSSITKSCELRQTETHPPPSYYKPRPMFYSGELPSTTRTTDSNPRNGHLSPYRNYRRTSVVSPSRNESPRSPYHHYSTATGPSYYIVPKRVDQSNNYQPKQYDDKKYSNFSGPILSNRRNYPVTPGSPLMVEKTLYVDSNTAKLTKSRQSSGRIDILKARGINNKPLVCGSLDASPPSTYHTFVKKNSHSNRSRQEQDHHHQQQHKRVQNSTVVLKTEDLAGLKLSSSSSSSPAVTPPPLPKSPSESWLSRNLNSVSPRNSFGGHSISNGGGGGAKVQSRKQQQQSTRPGYPGVVGSVKWETIVKSTYLMSDHGLYPEEPVTQVVVPKQSQTRK